LKFDDGSDITKTLGLAWDPISDHPLFSFAVLQSSSTPCRRSVLSTIARFYASLGLVSPVIAKYKIFLQQLCKKKLCWDERLPEAQNTKLDICCRFGRICRVGFWNFVLDSNSDLEIHGFCDASLEAYVPKGEPRSSRLLCLKSRVVSIKIIRGPKLKLGGADLLARFMH